MAEEPKSKSVDAVYTDIMTLIEEALAPLSPVARGMLLASVKSALSTMQRQRADSVDRIEKV